MGARAASGRTFFGSIFNHCFGMPSISPPPYCLRCSFG
jgi:hypothetical protein